MTSRFVRSIAAVLLGVAITLTLRGYQFGSGNHAVYLVAPLREVHPELLKNDWWATHTLQYHWAFTKLAAGLMRVGMIEPAFFVLYLGLVVLLHGAWLRVARAVGLDECGYLLSVLLYYLSAGGLGLGSYQFLQDSSFLPGNVANIFMLWGVLFWIEGKLKWSAVALAGAGLFHLNHAIVGILFWVVVWAVEGWKRRDTHGQDARVTGVRVRVLGLGLIVILSLPNLLAAVRLVFAGGGRMRLVEFVDLYVHLRHPHHYDPLSWPVALWVSFLWPIPLAVVCGRRIETCKEASAASSTSVIVHLPSAPLRRAAMVLAFFVALQIIAFLFAGLVYVSESLIQMSLFRFSIYAKLLTCIGAAGFLLDGARRRRVSGIVLGIVFLVALIVVLGMPGGESGVELFVRGNRMVLIIFIVVGMGGLVFVFGVRTHGTSSVGFGGALTNWGFVILVMVLLIVFRRDLGLRLSVRDDADADYLALCDFAREHTPVDAVFVVPPNEQVFRYRAQRAIVVNFKNVPQLSSEMGEWKERLEAVLGEKLDELPRRFDLAHTEIARRYESLSAEHLTRVAGKYSARYVVTTKTVVGRRAIFERGEYRLYDLNE